MKEKSKRDKEREEKFAVVALHIMSNKEQIIQPLIRSILSCLYSRNDFVFI